MKTKADMQLRHQELHQAFDELLACYLHSRRSASITDIVQSLMEYSDRQRRGPTCLEHEAAPEWTPTMGNVAALPEPIRRYVRALETKNVEMKDKLDHVANWLDGLAEAAERGAESSQRFESLSAAYSSDARNYRATAADIRRVTAPGEGR